MATAAAAWCPAAFGPRGAGGPAGSTSATEQDGVLAQLVAALRNRGAATALSGHPSPEAQMDARLHQAIAGKLEAGKIAGWLSDYLVAWHGPRERLAPEVTVWRAADQNDDAVRSYLSGLLSDLVPERAIVIADS